MEQAVRAWLRALGALIELLGGQPAARRLRAPWTRQTDGRHFGCGSKPFWDPILVGEFTTHFRTYFSGATGLTQCLLGMSKSPE